MQDRTSTPNSEALPENTGKADNAVPPAPSARDTAPGSAGGITLDPSPEVTVIPSAEDLLKAAELKAAEHHDAWLRAKAEGENIRRRAQEDIAKAGKFAVERFSTELLAVKDSLEAALASDGAGHLKEGVELTLRGRLIQQSGRGFRAVVSVHSGETLVAEGEGMCVLRADSGGAE